MLISDDSKQFAMHTNSIHTQRQAREARNVLLDTIHTQSSRKRCLMHKL